MNTEGRFDLPTDGFVRRARPVRVYDGDTVYVDIDLGWGMTFNNQSVRLAGLDTPEIRTKDADEKRRGFEARDYVRDWFANAYELGEFHETGWPLRLHSVTREKYGRVLGTIFRLDGRQINFDLINDGHAVVAYE